GARCVGACRGGWRDSLRSRGGGRGRGCFGGIEPVKNRETREPLVPFNATGDAFAPVARLSKAALERGLYLMTHWNVVMVCPPLTITREELEEGISILTEPLPIPHDSPPSHPPLPP